MPKVIPKKVRIEVYNKYGGHCAYCGKKLEYKDMQLDHIIPRRNWGNRYTEEQIECFENYACSCRSCNHYKRAHTLETFRRMIEEIPKKLFRNNYIYKIGLNYNLIQVNEHKIKFYFEELEEIKNVVNNKS